MFSEAVDLKSNLMDSYHFENNFKRTINCPINRLIWMSLVRTGLRRYHYSVTYVTQQWRSYDETFSFIVT